MSGIQMVIWYSNHHLNTPPVFKYRTIWRSDNFWLVFRSPLYLPITWLHQLEECWGRRVEVEMGCWSGWSQNQVGSCWTRLKKQPQLPEDDKNRIGLQHSSISPGFWFGSRALASTLFIFVYLFNRREQGRTFYYRWFLNGVDQWIVCEKISALHVTSTLCCKIILHVVRKWRERVLF